MSTITFQGKPLNTSGDLPKVGTKAPDFLLVNNRLQEVSLQTYTGKRKLLSIVPSLDTPTCAASTRIFNQKADSVENSVVLIVSADLPFAQERFCEADGLRDVIPLSTFRSNFAQDYGVEIVDTILAGLMTRAIIVIDESDQVVYTELVAEVADEPNYESALLALKGKIER